MAEEIRLDVVSVAHSRGLTDAAQDLQGLRGEADKTGKSFHRTADETFNLDRAIEEARVEVKRLNEEFRRTGDTTLFRNMRRQRSELSQLMRVAAEAAPDVDGGGLLKAIGGMSFRGKLYAAVAGGVALLAPLIGGVIGGAVLGTVGTGGMIGGILAASKDGRVRAAAKSFGTIVSDEFFHSGDAFVEPTVRSLRMLGSEVQNLDLGATLAKGAPSVEIMAKGIADLAHNAMPGLNDALERSPQAAAIAAKGFADIGSAVSEMLTDISRSEGTMDGLRALFDMTQHTIRILGNTVEWLGDRFHDWNSINAEVSGSMEDIAKYVPLLMPFRKVFEENNNRAEKWLGTSENMTAVMYKLEGGTKASTNAVGYAGQSWEDYQKSITEANEAMRQSISIALGLDNANLGLQQAMLNLNEELREGAKDWSTNTQEGLDNRRALLAAVEAAERKRQADIASGVDADKANAAYQRTIDKLRRMAKDAGISGRALDDLVGDYNVDIHVRTHGGALGAAIGTAVSKLLESKGRASGGPVQGPGDYIVGERQPEVLRLSSGQRGHVYPSISAARGAGGSAGGGRAMEIHIIIDGRVVQKALINEALGRGIGNATVRAAYP